MSEKNHEEKRGAREKLREQREQDKAADKRNRTLKMAGAVVAVLAVLGGIGALVAQRAGEESAARADAKPIGVGRAAAPATLTVYEDFRCPACAQFENQYRDTVRSLERQGKLRVDYHLVTIIDGNMGGSGSARAANAAACARDAGKFREYHDVLFREQPDEREDTFANTKHLIELAGKVDGLRGDDAFEACVRGGKHDAWVERSGKAFNESDYRSTPTILLDGENVYGNQKDPLTPEKLRDMVEKKA